MRLRMRGHFHVFCSLILSLVRKLAIRHPQNQCKIFTLGKPNSSLCQTRPINSETEDFVRQAVDGLVERILPLDSLLNRIRIYLML